jgi:hypothetical protein
MIHKVECESLSCDNCNKEYESCEGFTIFPDDVDNRASDDDWHTERSETEDDKHYCPNCYEVDDEDNVTVKKSV